MDFCSILHGLQIAEYSFNDIKILNLEKVFCDGLDIENKNLEQNTLKNNGFIKILSSLNSFISQAMFFFDIALWHCVNTL